MTSVNERPIVIQMADSIAASLKLISWGVRWTMRRSATNSTTIVPTSATHAHAGTSKLTNLLSSELDAASTPPRKRSPTGFGLRTGIEHPENLLGRHHDDVSRTAK